MVIFDKKFDVSKGRHILRIFIDRFLWVQDESQFSGFPVFQVSWKLMDPEN
jgi:hypothetical protein